MTVTGGAFAPTGTAQPVPQGYRVDGRWSFVSGSQHCAWLLGGCILLDAAGVPRMLARGVPDTRQAFFPATEVEIIDTWHVSGLRGTGSHDVAVRGSVVPEHRVVSMLSPSPTAAGPLYRFPIFGLLAVAVAAVALGIARSATEELTLLAAAKTPALSRNLLRDRPTAQLAAADAEAAWRAGRAFLLDAVGEMWEAVGTGAPPGLRQRALLRLGATEATAASARAVGLAYTAGGGSANYEASPLQRHLRDIHAVTQHAVVAPATRETVGRVLLGADAETLLL